MLFFNFICPFYLMLLCNGHTISKSIKEVENVDDIFDTPYESQSTRSFARHRHDRIHNKFRRLPDAPATLQIDPKYSEIDKKTIAETLINRGAPLDAKRGKFVRERNLPVKVKKKLHFWRWNRKKSGNKEKNTAILKETPHKHSTEHNIRKVSLQAYNLPETRLRIPELTEANKGYFHKLSDLEKYDVNHVTSDKGLYKIDESSNSRDSDYSLLESGPLGFNDGRLKRTPTKRKWHASKHKQRRTRNSRDMRNVEPTVRSKTNKRSVDTSSQKPEHSHITKSTKHSLNLTTIPNTWGNLTITESSTVHDNLPEERKEPKTTTGKNYTGTSTDQNTTSTSKMDQFTTEKMSPFNVNLDSNIDTMFIQSSAIEELLKHIKDKNFEYTRGQNPMVTSLVVGTVTQATLDAMPVNPKLRMPKPERHQSKPKSDNRTVDEGSTIERTTPMTNVLDEQEPNYLNHNINVRSVNQSKTLNSEEHDIDRQVKDLCNKLQHKAESDLKVELDSINSIIKKSMSGNVDKPKFKKHKPLDYVQTKNFRDDYVMLNENLLSREHQTNIINMMATQRMLTGRYVKRDTIEAITNMEATSSYLQETPDRLEVINDKVEQENPIQEISNKISYSDFVNGYKYYLDFQREQGQQNFSNQIKYQAHKHHNVDDIGKFILNRIPPVPSKAGSFDYDSITNASVNYDPSMKQFFVIIQPPTPKKTDSGLANPIQLFEKNINSTGTKTISENYDFNASKNPDNNPKIFKANIDNKKDINLDVLTNILEETDKSIKDSPPSMDNVLNLKIKHTDKGFHIKNLMRKLRPKAKSTTNHDSNDAHDTERISISLDNKHPKNFNYAKRNRVGDYEKRQMKFKRTPDLDYVKYYDSNYHTVPYTNVDQVNEDEKKKNTAEKREIKNCFKKLKHWVSGRKTIKPESSTTQWSIRTPDFLSNHYKLYKGTVQNSDTDKDEGTDVLFNLINNSPENTMAPWVQVTETSGLRKGQTVGIAPEIKLEKTTPRTVTDTSTIVAEEIRASMSSLASDSAEKKITQPTTHNNTSRHNDNQNKQKHTTRATTRGKTTSKAAHHTTSKMTTLPETTETSTTPKSTATTDDEGTDSIEGTEDIEKMIHAMSVLKPKTTESITDMIKRILSGSNGDALLNSTLSQPSTSTVVEDYIMNDEKRIARDYLSVAENKFSADELLKQINYRIKKLKSMSKNSDIAAATAYNIRKFDLPNLYNNNDHAITGKNTLPDYFNDLQIYSDLHFTNPHVSQSWQYVLSSLKPHGWSPRSYAVQRNNQYLNDLMSSYATAKEPSELLIPKLEKMSTVNLMDIRRMYQIPTTTPSIQQYQMKNTIEDENIETKEFMRFGNEPTTKLDTTTPTAVKFDAKTIWPNVTIPDGEADAEKIYEMFYNKNFKEYKQQKHQCDNMKTFVKNPITFFDEKLFSTIPSYNYGPTSTLLPMDNEDFELFLKENSMDVQKVTRPLTELFDFIETWTPEENSYLSPKKPKKMNQIQQNKAITRSVYSNAIAENTPEIISNIEANARHVSNENNRQTTKTKFKDDVNFVPYEEDKHANNDFTHDESLISQKSNDIMQNTAKSKKCEFRKESKRNNKKNKIQSEDLTKKRKDGDSDNLENDIEITFVSTNNDSNATNLQTDQKDTDIRTTDFQHIMPTTKKMHENTKRSYKVKVTKKMSNYFPINISTSNLGSPAKILNSNRKTTNSVVDVFSFSNSFQNTRNYSDYNNVFMDMKEHKMKPGAEAIAKALKKKPHRIQVTSNSYKYDVIYDDSNRDATSDVEQSTTETLSNESQIMSSYKSDVKNHDTRTTKYKSSAPKNPVNHVTFVYDLKHLNRTEKDFNKKSNLKDNMEKKESETTGMKEESLLKRDLEYDTNDIEGVLASNVLYNLFTKKSEDGSNNRSSEKYPDLMSQSEREYTKPPKVGKSKHKLAKKKKVIEFFLKRNHKQNDTSNKTHARRVRQDYRSDKDLQGLQVVLDIVKNPNESTTDLMDGATKPSYECIEGADLSNQRKRESNIDIHISIPVAYKMEEKFLATDMQNNIDYQSLLQSITSTAKPGIISTENFTPGMYVLVDDPNMAVPRGKFLIKPIKSTNFKIGHNSKQFAPKLIIFTPKPEIMPEQRTTAKMPVSKDFVSAVNKQLLDIYNNLTALAIPRPNTRKARTDEKKTKLQQLLDNIKNKENQSSKSKNEHRNLRGIHWNQTETEQNNAANCSCNHLNHNHDHCSTICLMNKNKRQTKHWNNQVESPLITDSGGSFWYDYIHKGTPANIVVDKGTKPKEKSHRKFNNFVTKYFDFHLCNKTDMHYSTGESTTKVTVTPTTITEQETKLPSVSTHPMSTTRKQYITTEPAVTSKIVIVTNAPSLPPTTTIEAVKTKTNVPNPDISRSKISEDTLNDANIEPESYYLNKGNSPELDNFTSNVEQLMELIARVHGDRAEEGNRQNEAVESFFDKTKTNVLDANPNKCIEPPTNESSPPPCPAPCKTENTTKPPPDANNSCASQINQIQVHKHLTEDYKMTPANKFPETDDRRAGYIEHVTTETFTTLPLELNDQNVYTKTTPFVNFTKDTSKPLHEDQTTFPSTAPLDLNILINHTYTKSDRGTFNNVSDVKNVNDLRYKIKPADPKHTEVGQSLLFSLLRYEKNKLNNELKRFANGNLVHKNLEATDDNNYQSSTKRSVTEETYHAASRPTKTTKLSMLQRLASKMGIQHTRGYKHKKANTSRVNLKPRSVTLKMYREATTTTRKCKKKLYELTTEHTTLSHVTSNETVDKTTEEATPTEEVTPPPIVMNEMPPQTTATEVAETEDAAEADIEDAKEDCDPTNPNEKCICDLQATHDRVLENYKRMKLHDFENYVRNISCHKYKRLPDYFLLAESSGPHYKGAKGHVKRSRGQLNPEWNWIRNKRSLLSVESFEIYTRNNAGLYRGVCKKRRKRTLDTSTVIGGLTGLPGLDTGQDELYAMVGDTITLNCRLREDLNKVETPNENDEFVWKTDRSNMLKLTNVAVEGQTVSMRDLTLHNMGKYDCLHNGILIRTIMVTVVAVPVFHVVFVPIYNTEDICQYNDLTMVNDHLATQMQAAACPNPQFCTVRVDEPTCLKVEEESLGQLRVTAVISTLLRDQRGVAAVHCSPQCRRDLQCSLTLLSALAAPSLAKIALYLVSHDGNRTMSVSSSGHKKMLVTHTLKNKDSNNHHEYHRVSAHMMPGDIDVVVSCPAGFYLLAKLKICLACQANSYAAGGANECKKCPAGWHSDPGSERCHNPLSPRDLGYDHCGRGCRIFVGLLVTFLSLCTLSVLCGLWHCRKQQNNSTKTEASKLAKSPRSYSAFVDNIRGADKSKTFRRDRHLSPSRVILARLFRSSPSPSSRLTDSQETRFGARKGAKPPSVPPIDFEF